MKNSISTKIQSPKVQSVYIQSVHYQQTGLLTLIQLVTQLIYVTSYALQYIKANIFHLFLLKKNRAQPSWNQIHFKPTMFETYVLSPNEVFTLLSRKEKLEQVLTPDNFYRRLFL